MPRNKSKSNNASVVVPDISKALVNQKIVLDQQHEECAQRMASIIEREKELETKERGLKKFSQNLKEKAKKLDVREEDLNKKLYAREKHLSKIESGLKKKQLELDTEQNKLTEEAKKLAKYESLPLDHDASSAQDSGSDSSEFTEVYCMSHNGSNSSGDSSDDDFVVLPIGANREDH